MTVTMALSGSHQAQSNDQAHQTRMHSPAVCLTM